MSVRTVLLSSASCLALLIGAAPGQAIDLRPGGASISAINAATAAAQASAAQAAALAQQSQKSLAETMRAIQQMQQAQAAARTQAIAGPNRLIGRTDVPNGLAVNGLNPDSGLPAPTSASGATTNYAVPTSWQSIGGLSQTQNGNRSTTVSVSQSASAAIANWTTFNVGKNTLVDFNQQGNPDWVVLNRVLDPSGLPSQILGQIKADGQVLLINQNGIIFGGSSQINVHTLVASALDITINSGSSSLHGADANQAFLQNGLFSNSFRFTNGAIINSGAANFDQGSGGAVVVQPGAVIDTTQNLTATGDGGYVALLGASSVTNSGTITTRNGQIILAASSGGGNLITPALGSQGTQTALQVLSFSDGAVINDGNGVLVSADGAVTLAGGQIDQRGSIEATTSVTRPGSISLNAGGNILLRPSSVIAILPDENSGTLPTATANSTITTNSGTTASYFSAILQPQISITAGGNVDVQGNGAGLGGALIKAPGAALTITAGSAAAASGQAPAGTVLLEPGSSIDLSGLAGVTLPMSVNQVSILVTANEVADTPLARSLIGQTVIIDARLAGTRADGFHWVGSPILDAAGFVGLIPETIDQILTVGGTFAASGLNVIQQPGSVINVSGGAVNYLGGVMHTTALLGSDGRLYNIGSADPTISYLGVAGQFTVDHARWGVTQTWSDPLLAQGQFQPGYVVGTSAGSVRVTATNPILEGSIVANVVAGDRQRALAGSSNVAASDQMPTGGSLSIQFASAPSITGTGNLNNVVLEPRADAGSDPYGLIAGGFSFNSASSWSPLLANNTFPVFSDLLTSASLNSVSITGSNQLSMPADATLSVRPGGSITLDGVSTINGALNAPSGAISLTGFTYKSGVPQQPPAPAVVIGPDAVLNVRGLWVNDAGLRPDAMQGPSFINGGSVSITTLAASNGPARVDDRTDVTQSIVLSPGSVIDVSSGGYVGPTSKLKLGSDGLLAGKGGNVTLITYSGRWQDAPSADGFFNPFNSFPASSDPRHQVNFPNQANVSLGGTIDAQGFDGGGTFTLQAPIVTIDGTVARVTYPAGTPGEIVFPAAFFSNSGFSQYTLTSTYGSTTVTAGTQLVLRAPSLLPSGVENQIPTGAIARSFEPVGFLPDGLRKPVSLTLVEKAFVNVPTDLVSSKAGLLIDSGTTIVADPQATVSLVAAGPVTVLGSIVAHGGAINLVNDPTLTITGIQRGQSLAAADVWIGPNAMLDVSGVFVPNPRVTAFSSGTVLDGGTITLGASGGSIVVRPGARLDLQGAQVLAASDLIQVPSASLSGRRLVSETEWSNGGTLQLAGSNVYFAGTVNAAGGAPAATGSTLTASAGAIVVEPGGIIAANLPPVSAAAFPLTPSDLSSMVPSTPGAFIGADTLNNSGFDSVNLNGSAIAFNGSVNVSLPGALTLNATVSAGGHFVLLPSTTTLLPSGVTGPLSFMPPPCTPAEACIPSIGSPTVNLNAGYVRIVGFNGSQGGHITSPKLADGTLNVTAQWIDLERAIAIDNASNVNLTSAGAIRLLPDNYGFVAAPGVPQTAFGGALIAPGNLTLQAAEIYPVSNTQFLLMSLGTLASDSTLTIKQNGTATAPLSAGGGILLDAKTIVQDGTLWAPLGGIVIGLGVQGASQIPASVSLVMTDASTYSGPFTVTQNVTLGPGSLTSVSAAGLDIPDGYTIDSVVGPLPPGAQTPPPATGGIWYQGTPNGNPSANNLATVLAAPPAKSIGIFGANIATQAGAVIDLSGGGDIYATEYVSGTGGTRNVLTTYPQVLSAAGTFSAQYADGRQVYALVPSYEARVAAYDPNFADYPYYSGQAVPPGTSLSSFTPGTQPFNGIAPGTSITIAGGNGLPAGTYTLLPGMYATLPGAFRAVQVAGNVSPTITTAFTGPDGSQYVTGTFTNALTGARSSQQALFQLQSGAVWSKYSQINISSGTTFFRNQALAAGAALPPLPIDAGVLSFGATGTLSLLSTNRFGPGSSDLAPGLQGAGGQVQIGSANILILAGDKAEPPADCAQAANTSCTGTTNYLVLDADQISNLGAASVLIGGTAAASTNGITITANAVNLEVATDAAHPLTAPELILVSLAPTSANPSVHGITVDAGSVIRAVGTVPAGTDRDITIGALPVLNPQNNTYSGQVSGDGSLLRVSNGATVSVTRLYVPGIYTGPGPLPPAAAPLGQITLGTAPGTASVVAGASVVIDGGNALAIDTSGNNRFAPSNNGVPGVTLIAQNYDLSGSIINVGGGSAGLVLDSGVIAGLAGATSVRLRSASVFNLFDTGGLVFGNPGKPIGTLTFDGAGLFSQGGTTTIDALNVVLTDSQSTPNTSGALTGPATGTLSVNAGGTFTERAGAVTLGNFSQVNLAANQAIGFGGAGSLNIGAANVSLTAPALLVNGGATQSLTTSGAVTIAAGAGTAPQPSGFGGALSINGASIADSGTILAPSGNVTLTAKLGDVALNSGALISATGTVVTVVDQTEFAPGGRVALTSNTGNVTINAGATVDVSAAGNGDAGTLTITAANGQVSLGGTLTGGAAFKDAGGSFALNANSLAGTLPFSAFTGSFTVALQNGDITVPAATTLSSGQVSLTANNGSVTVDGTIDASGPSGGSIALYGANSVMINAGAVLNASYQGITDPRDPGYANGASTLVQNGGTIMLGTTGGLTGNVDTTGCGGAGCGYETVASSGTITVAAGAILNVSGGPGTTNVSNNGGAISNTGGQVILRAPILQNGSVNIGFHGTLETNADANGNPSGNGVIVDAYAVWSTTDSCLNAACATIDSTHPFTSLSPAQRNGLSTHFDGIIDPAGWFFLSNGTVTQVNGSTPSGSDIFTPSTEGTPAIGGASIYQPHQNFYQTTLVNFVQSFYTLADFSNARLEIAGSGATAALPSSLQHNRPEIDLVNPSAAINSGNITVASNWNLGGVQTAPSASFNSPLNPANYQPAYRTTNAADRGEPGALTLRAANNVQINATISDGFYETYEAFNRSASTSYELVADLIANNPAVANKVGNGSGAATVDDLNTTSAASLMPIVPGKNVGSFSFDFVAGAAAVGGGATAPSANPDAVIALSSAVSPTSPSDSVIIAGHTTYANPLTAAVGKTIDIPTLVRTGTGSITIAAGGNVEFTDTVVQGAVYTAGAAITMPSNFTQPTIPTSYFSSPNGLVTAPTWAMGGGPVTVTAAQDIIGIETLTDPAGSAALSQTGVLRGPTGQFWSPWYVHYGQANGTSVPFANIVNGTLQPCTIACQTAAWINYATFFQGFGALGGGNITLKAGADIFDVGASLPETLAVSGGGPTGTPTAGPLQANYFGGGNLVVNAGGNINSGDFLVGRGAGLIQAGGAVQVDNANPITGQQTVVIRVSGSSVTGTPLPLPLLLAVQDGFVSVTARGPLTLGNVYDPASLPPSASVQTPFADLPGAAGIGTNPRWGNFFTSYGPESGVSLTSTAGDVTTLTVPSPSNAASDDIVQGLFVHTGNLQAFANSNGTNGALRPGFIGSMLPATLDLSALSGNVFVNVNVNLVPYPTQSGSDTGTIAIVAAQSINLGGLMMPDLTTAASQFFGNRPGGSAGSDLTNYISPLGTREPNLTVALHANDTVPAVIAAGQDITLAKGHTLSLIKPAEIEAGHNIVFGTGLSNDATFIGQNNNIGDITSIVAGNNIVGGSYVLYGPGTFVLEAGHDMGPFEPSLTPFGSTSQTFGVGTIGDGSAISTSFAGSNSLPFRPYLPSQGAELDVLFGVGPGINYAAAINQYVNPASAGAGGISFLPSVARQIGELLDRLANAGKTNQEFARQLEALLAAVGLPPVTLNQAGLVDHSFTPNLSATTSAAWSFFQTGLTPQQQRLMVDRAFLDFLTEVAKEDKNPASPFFNQFGRAYQAIATLFPASLGYTNNASGGANGAASTVLTGKLNMAASVIETQMGGDINIIGPGGGITVGHTSLDLLNPSQEGVLTLAGGAIRVYTDGSILLNQSRIMTQQTGNIDMFSANGDINAGAGPKSYASDPAISDICNTSGFCFVNPSGLVTGAGIAAVTALPGETAGDVTLAAPHGTIDAGAAGLRGNNITLVALQVLNAYNIQATGTVTGLTFTPPPNVGNALTGQSAIGATQANVAAPTQSASTVPSVIIVEVIGYGGDNQENDNIGERRQQQQ